MELDIVRPTAITVICYFIGETVKVYGLKSKWIPIIELLKEIAAVH